MKVSRLFEGQKFLKVSYKSFNYFRVNNYPLVSNRFTVRSSYLFAVRTLFSYKRNKRHAFKLFTDKLICLLFKKVPKNRYRVQKEKVTKNQKLLKYRQSTNQRLYHYHFQKHLQLFFRSHIEWNELGKLNRRHIVLFTENPKTW